MIKTLSRTLYIGLLCCFLDACTDDYFEFDKIKFDDWRPELAFPLVNSSLSLGDIIEKSDSNGIVQPNPKNEILEVIYEGRVFSTQGEEIISLPNQSFTKNVMLATPIIPSPNGGTINENFEFTLDFNLNSTELEIDSILLKRGLLALTVENDFEHNVLLEISLPTFTTQDGNSLVLNYNIPPAPSSSGTSVRSIVTDISTYNVNLTEEADGSQTVNKFPVFIEATFNLTPNKGSNSNDELRFIGSIRNLNFQTFSGYVGQIELELDEDSIGIDLFKNFIDGDFFLSNPFLDITVSNSFGIPIDLTFQKIVGFNPTKSPKEIDVIFPFDPNTGKRNVRRLNSPTMFGSAKTLIELNNTNSNVADVVSFLPKEIIYDAKTNFNVNGKTSSRNFFSDTSQIGLDVFLRLPFEGYVSDFLLVDTIDFSFDNTDDIESGLIRMRAENGFPVESDVQIIFLDSAYLAIDSLYPDGQESIIPSSITNADGETISNSVQITDTEISRDRIKALTNGRFIIIKANLKSQNAPNQTVRFYDSYRLDINLGLKATILIK